MPRGRPKLADDVKSVTVTLPMELVKRIERHARRGFFGDRVKLAVAIRDLIETGLDKAERKR